MHDRRRRFALRLALELGWPNVDAMLREMPEKQFTEWLAFYQLEPFGILAEDTLSAHWKALYYNMNRGRGKQARKIKDYLIFRDQQQQKDASVLFEDEE